MKEGRTLIDLAQELTRQSKAKQDMIVPSPLMRFTTDCEGTSRIWVRSQNGELSFGTTDLANRQLAAKLAIPYIYFERMREREPELLDRNVNTWLHSTGERRLVRTLDGKVRAVLSERYRRLDNYDLAEHVLPILQQLPGGRLASAEITETRMYLKWLRSELRDEIKPGDVVEAGVVVTNSEVGLGSLTVQPLLHRLICRNGLIAPDHSLRKTHVGRYQAALGYAVQIFKDDTLEAEDKAFFLKARDVVENAVSEVIFRELAERMRKTLGIPLCGDPVKSVEVVGTKFLLNEEERNGVLRHLIQGGDPTGYGLVNAVTHYSQEITRYDRATDFEALGGKLINLSAREWKEISEAK